MKVKVQITETLQRSIKVEAKDEQDALDYVKQQYVDERIVLDSNDCTDDTEFEVVT
ncbi:hypothetical protein LCGC14_0929010 [marine sediment metagenome]|uniref:DpnD/PcfM-like C-terminal domain-containing protein n=1 Tax=marine sediment metagenome TaxID=412755 RepID=A0A0F9NNI8_9ZZZZ